MALDVLPMQHTVTEQLARSEGGGRALREKGGEEGPKRGKKLSRWVVLVVGPVADK